MKELSLEEKAQRYDEAIKRAGEIHNEHKAQPFDVMLKIFPELKKSEDERIRKEIISAIKEDWPGHEDWIVWLETQGEQEFADGTFVNVDDVREDFVQEVYRVLDADSTNDRANQIIDAFDNLPTVTIEKQGEQKPAWSEEDDNMIMSINHHLDSQKNYVTNTTNIEQCQDWLKSLRPQNRWKPSGEQMFALNIAIEMEDGDILKSLYNDLKKLRKE